MKFSAPPRSNPRFRLAGLIAAHTPAPVTLATVSFREATDDDLGLAHDPVAQRRAEEFVQAAAARRLRDEDAGRRAMLFDPVERKDATPVSPPLIERPPTVPPVRVTVPDDALILVDHTDTAEDVEEAIVRELRRLTEKPQAGLH